MRRQGAEPSPRRVADFADPFLRYNNKMRVLRPLLALVLLCAAAAAGSTPSSPAPDLGDLMRRVADRARWEKQHRADARYTWQQKRVVEKLAGDGQVEERTETLLVAEPVDGRTFYRTLQKNGRPLSPEEQAKEAGRANQFRQALRDPKKGERNVELNEELLARYTYQYVGEESVAGRPAYVLAFAPRPGKLPENHRMDRVLNRTRGKVWIDRATYAIARIDIELTEPVSFFIGLGVVRNLRFTAEMMPVSSELLMPREVKLSFDARRLFTNIRTRQHSEYTGYRPLTTSAEKAPR